MSPWVLIRSAYCAFDIFQKAFFCMALYTEVNLQTFVMIKMNANCAEICRVGNLETDLQQGPLVQNF